MAEEFLPIMMIKQRTVDDTRVEPGGSSDKPGWVLTGDELIERAQELSLGLLSSYDNEPHNSAMPYVFEVKLDGRDTAKSKRTPVVDMLDIEGADGPSHVVGMKGSSSLIVQAKDTGQVQTIAARIEDYERYDIALSCISGIERFKPEIESTSERGVYKARLIDFGDNNDQYEEAFETSLITLGVAFERIEYAKDLIIYRLHADAEQVRAIADGTSGESLFYIRSMPTCRAVLDGDAGGELPDVAYPDPSQDYPIVGVLDNGISRIKHLEPWLLGNRISNYIDSDIAADHGTFVGGVITYGDALEQKDWVGGLPVRLVDGAVFPSNGEIDEGELVENIRFVVSKTYQQVKVYNLSISFEPEIRDDAFSDLGIALDDIQDEFGVLICKSAGNFRINVFGTKRRILQGADSVRAITVGSAAHAKGEFDMAEVGNASPFSRKGPGPEFIIKPEVSHYGGNAGIDPLGHYKRTEVHSFDVNGNGAYAVGTSFSTPRISALAANLHNAIDADFDPLLIKALIAHSAIFPGDALVPTDEKVMEMGFGVPKSMLDILGNDPHTATIVLRGTLRRGESIDILDFPMPKSLVRDGYYKGQITLTAALSPLRAASQGSEYCQSDLEVKFGSFEAKTERDITQRTIMNLIGKKDQLNLLLTRLYSKPKMREATTDFARRERMLIQYEGKYAPMKKYAVDFDDLTPANREKVADGRLWYLHLKGTYRDYVEREARKSNTQLEQEYCIIVSIHDPLEEAMVYNEVAQLLEQLNFWHQNIQLTNQVRAMIGQSR